MRTETELKEALDKLAAFKQRLTKVNIEGNRQYNPGWHLALDLRSMLEVSEAATLAAHHPGEVIGVSNEVGSGVVPVTQLGRRYQDLLGEVNAIWVAQAARAALVVAGRPLWLPDAPSAYPK